MLKITESANVAHYVCCDWIDNATVILQRYFFRSTTNSCILNTNTKKRSKKGDKRTQKQRLQIHV